MSRPTVTVISAKGESSKDTITVPNVFKVSSTTLFAIRDGEQILSTWADATHTHTLETQGSWCIWELHCNAMQQEKSLDNR
jgi:hypothetical protein